MNTANAIVVGIRDDRRQLTVRVDAVACARCSAGRGCGAGIGAYSSTQKELKLPLDVDAARLHIGDEVTLRLQSGQLLKATLLAYGIPLLCASAAAATAHLAGATEPVSVLSALAGLAAGIAFSLVKSRRMDCMQSWTPRIDPGRDGLDP